MSVIELADRVVGYDLAGSGPPLVLCHSLGADRSIFAAQITDLASDHTVLAFDLRGHGETGVGTREPSLDALADDLLELVDALDVGPAHFAGQSIGAMTLLAFASRHPARPATYLVLDAVAHTDPGWDERYRARAQRVLRHGVEPEARELAERSLGPTTRERDPGFVERYAATLAVAPAAGYAWACRAMIGFDLRPRLAEIDAPVLVAAGAEDALTTPGHAREIAAAIAGAEFAEIAGSGHVPCLEQPDATTALIREWTGRRALVGR